MVRPKRESAARILEVARRCFETYGYRRTNIAEIARDAGVAAGTQPSTPAPDTSVREPPSPAPASSRK